MSEECPDPIVVARMVSQHLASLHAAGVEWLPAAAAPIVLGAQVPAEPASVARQEPRPPSVGATPVERSESSLEPRRVALEVLAREVAACQRCPELASTRTQTVFADGNVGVDLCLIGEAPGADEDAQGVPFVGAAGQLLNKILAACGLRREEVYICNTIKCRPPGNRTPLVHEVANCRGFLEKQLELLQPRFICTLGGSAAQALLQTTQPMGKLRGRFHDYRGTPVMCTYHPAYLLPHRAPHKKREVWEDMKMLMERMGQPVRS